MLLDWLRLGGAGETFLRSLWSEKMLSILFSLFLCSSLSPCSSFSPITWPVRLLLGAGVPSSSAGETTWILLAAPAFPPSSPPPSPPFLLFSACRPGLPAGGEAALLSSLSFLAFLILSSSSLSGDLNTFLAGAAFSSSSDLSLSCSESSSLLLLRRLLELERLACMARLSDLSPDRCSAFPALAGPV